MNKFYFQENIAAMGIYKIIAEDDGYFYIGSSSNLLIRWKEHKNKLINNTHENIHLQRRFNSKNQKWIFQIEEEVLDKDSILKIEQKYLDLNFSHPKCMNLNAVASKPPSWKNKGKSKIHKAKIILTKVLKGIYKKINIEESILKEIELDKDTSIEIRNLCSQILNKIPLNIQFKGTKAKGIPNPKTSERMKGNSLRKGKVGTFLGKKHTEEVKEKLRQLKRKR